MTDRRSFIKQAGLTSVAAATLPMSSLLAASSPKLKILILGGTGFLTRHSPEATRSPCSIAVKPILIYFPSWKPLPATV